MAKNHNWTEEQLEFLKSNIKGKKICDLKEIFNEHFNLDLREGQIRSCAGKYKLKNGVTPSGIRPTNYKPVGSERVIPLGYTDVKVADPDVWKRKHQVVWEKHHGPIPDGYVIIFGDGDIRNFDINNLLCITLAQRIRLNYTNLIQNDVELTKVAINIVDLQMKINEVSRKGGDK